VRLSVGARLALVAVATGVVTATALSVTLALQLSDSGQREAAAVTRSVAETIAHEPGVAGLVAAADSDALQPIAVDVMADADVSFVTVMTPDGVRLTHRDPEEIGRTYLGTTAPALAGETFTEVYEGTLGDSVRTIAPIYADADDGGELVGMVSVGETLDSVQAQLAPRIPVIVGVTAAVVALALVGAFLVRRSASRVAGTLTPDELHRLVANYETVLHSIREGLVVTDASGRIRLYNDEAADLLGLPPASAGLVDLDPAEAGIGEAVAAALADGRRMVEQTIVDGDRVLLVNQEEARDLQGGRAPGEGHVMTLRDRSELQHLLGELDSVRTLTATLRSQTHEHGNRLHTVLALLELDRVTEARTLLADSVALRQPLADRLVGQASDAAVAALLLGKLDEAGERGVELRLDVPADAPALPLPAADAVTVVGNLVDNALDAASAGDEPRRVQVRLEAASGRTVLSVSDSGAGFDAALDDPFAFGASTKPSGAAGGRGVGLALVRDTVTAHHGAVAVSADPTTVTVTLPAAAPEAAR
jgi:two-component system, CitB family, sensor kinase